MIKILLRFFALMPLPLNHLIGAIFGWLLFQFPNRAKKIVGLNIAWCFKNLNTKEQQKMTRKSLMEMGKGLTEIGYIWHRSFVQNAKKIKKFHGREWLKNEKPTILMTPHFGCWEMTGRIIALDVPLTFLYKPPDNPDHLDLLFSKRQKGNLNMASAGYPGVKKLHRVLAAGGVVGILPDQDVNEKSGAVVADFFAAPVPTMTLLVRLARAHNAQILLTWAKRLKRGRGFELHLKPLDILSPAADIRADVARMNREIENLIRSAPEQYLWHYKRFKSVINYEK